MTPRRLVSFVVIAGLLAGFAGTALAWANGVRFYAVDSGSMSPTIATGALVVDLPVGPTTVYSRGDIVTFHPTPRYTVTHRVASVGADGISTKGDANPSRDVGTIQPDMIVGRVAFSVPYAGYVAVFFQHPVWVVALLLLLIAPLAVWQLTAGAPAPDPAEKTLSEGSR